MQPIDIVEATHARIRELEELIEAGLICRAGDFFPSVHYPPITMYPPLDEETLFEGYESPGDGLFVLYVHIPFCRQYCAFCHYPNLLGERPLDKDRYLDALAREMDSCLARLGLPAVKARSILVGGGTPTYLSPAQLARFLRDFTARADLSRCTQFNYDVDPMTLLGADGDERLAIMRAHGVGRLTIGVQSLDDAVLQLMNRHHTAREALQAVERARRAGFQVNIELIFGYEGQTLEGWAREVEQAAGIGVEEIQLYRLKFIPYGDHAGRVCRAREGGGFPAPRECIAMKAAAIAILGSHGYHENLTRVFTREKRHFSHYAADQCCNLFDQLGFGLTAFSSLRDRFGLNTQSFEEYYRLVHDGKLPLNRGLVRDQDAQRRWHMILPLKNRKVYTRRYERGTGAPAGAVFGGKLERLKRFGLIEEDAASIALTTKGRFFADEVCQQFHSPATMPFPRDAYCEGPLNPYRE